MIKNTNNSSLKPKISDFSRNSMKKTRARKNTNKVEDYTDSNFRYSSNDEEQCGFCSTQALIQNYSNFKRSGVPIRFMYYSNGRWIGFSTEIFELLKKGFIESKPVVVVSIEGLKYCIDFFRMLQIDLGTGNRRSISWMDVNKNCFFPKFTVEEKDDDCCEVVEFPKVEIEIRFDQNSIKKKRKRSYSREIEGYESSSDVQQSVVKRPRTPPLLMEKAKWPNVEILNDEQKNYIDIKKIFLSGLNKIDQDINITSIHRCIHTGPIGIARLQAFQTQIELTKTVRGGESDVRLAWHGTSLEGVANIILHGFGLNNKPSDSEAAYGDGIYLSPARSPETSAMLLKADNNGEKHLMLCRVIMGNIERVEIGSNQSHPSNEDFDTGVDNLANPRWYIVWSTHMNSHILPEFIVSYKSFSDHQKGLPTGTPTSLTRHNITPSSAISFPNLFAAMKSSLPASSIQELESLYRLFKEGKEAKDVLIRQIRSIAGDQLITSTVHKLRGFMN